MQLRYFICALVLVFCASTYARSGIELYQVRGKKRVLVKSNQKTRWGWKSAKSGIRTVNLSATLQSSFFKKFEATRKRGRHSTYALKGSLFAIRMQRLSKKVTLKQGRKRYTFQAKLNMGDRAPVIDENCKKFNLQLKSESSSLPFYVGTSCNKTSKSLNITLSYPAGVLLESSNLRETRGKGEQWKFYELGKVKQAVEDIASFKFQYRGKKYNFTLSPIKIDAVEDEPPSSIFLAGAGYSLLGISGVDINADVGNPILAVRVPHYGFYKGLGLAFLGEFALSLSSGATSIKYSQFGFFGSYEWKLGSFRLYPRVGYTLSSQSETSTGISLSSSYFALALRAAYDLNAAWAIEVGGMMSNLGSEVVSTHYAVELRVLRKKEKTLGWGAGAKLQSFVTLSNLGIQRKFTETLFFGFITF